VRSAAARTPNPSAGMKPTLVEQPLVEARARGGRDREGGKGERILRGAAMPTVGLRSLDWAFPVEKDAVDRD